MKVCDKTCIFFFFPIVNKYFLMAKRSLLPRCPSYVGVILEQACVGTAVKLVSECVANYILWITVIGLPVERDIFFSVPTTSVPILMKWYRG